MGHECCCLLSYKDVIHVLHISGNLLCCLNGSALGSVQCFTHFVNRDQIIKKIIYTKGKGRYEVLIEYSSLLVTCLALFAPLRDFVQFF